MPTQIGAAVAKSNSSMRHRSSKLLFLLFTFLCSLSLFSETLPLSKFVEGKPKYRNIEFPESINEETEVTRLKNPKLLWINYSLLREMGVEIPEDTAQFEKEVLEHFAWGIPQGDADRKSNYTSDKNLSYADKYGGAGLGEALGSGRAAAMGSFQIKGIGITSLVDPNKFKATKKKNILANGMDWLSSFSHQHGGVSLTEGVREAEFGEILHRELPYGANRVAFLISTGTSTKYSPAYSEARSLIVRENSIRPAHFMVNTKGLKDNKSSEVERLKNYWPTMIQSLSDLGMLKGKTNPEVKEALLLYARRVAEINAILFVRKIYRGAKSPSNIELAGRMIDYGGFTLTPGYAKLTYADNVPNGDPSETRIYVLNDFIKSLKKTVPDEAKEAVPLVSESGKVFDASYQETLSKEFLSLLGVPKEWVLSLSKSEIGKKLAEQMLKLAKKGNSLEIDSHSKIPKVQGSVDFDKAVKLILTKLFSNEPTATEYQKELSKIYALLPEFVNQLEVEAKHENVSMNNLFQYMVLASQKRNHTFFPLVRGAERTLELMDAENLAKNHNADYLHDYISLMVEKGVKNTPFDSPLTISTETRIYDKEGVTLSKAFDAKTGQTEVWVDFNLGSKSPKKIEYLGDEVRSNTSRFVLPDAPLDSTQFKFFDEEKTVEFNAHKNAAQSRIDKIQKYIAPTVDVSFNAASKLSQSAVKNLDMAQKQISKKVESCKEALSSITSQVQIPSWKRE